MNTARISRRRLLTVVVATPLVASLLAACGERRETEGQAAPVIETFPAPLPNSLMLRIDHGVGAFTTPDYAFAEIPAFVLQADGLLVRPGPQIEIYPPPMLPALESVQLTTDERSSLMSLAEEAGLAATPPDYAATAPPVADAGATLVTIVSGGETYVHRAEALGMEDSDDPARSALASFVSKAEAFVGGLTTAGEVYHPSQYVVGFLEVDPSVVAGSVGDVAPTVVAWPAAFGAPVAEGTPLAATVVEEALATANQLTFFTLPDGRTAQLLLRPVLPTA